MVTYHAPTSVVGRLGVVNRRTTSTSRRGEWT